MVNMRFEGRTAIVTGGASGIGRGICLKLAEEGANIVVADVEREPALDEKPTDELVEEKGSNSLFVETDVSDEEEVKELVYTAASEFGEINMLVNNAGIHGGGSVVDTSEEEWDKIQSVNLKGAFLCSKHVIHHMLEEEIQGDIVNIGSIAGLVGFAQNSPYCASKGGIVELTRSMAVDYGPKGININAVDPGVIKTAMTKPMLEDEETRQNFEAQTLAPRLGQPEDIANAVAYLLSEESDFVMGSNLVVDGGWTAK
ncbi:MAG: SDR family NAD(P)-dependent oxidoreductase [Candidatus Nanohalobium sp.]